MGPTLGQAVERRMLLTLRCDRQRAGLKSVRPCQMPSQLHLPSLIAALGPDVDVDELQKRIRCPRCGSTRFFLQFTSPPGADAGTADTAPPRRRMAPASGMHTLASTPDLWIVFQCDLCGRRGEIRKEKLLQEFDPEIPMPTFLPIFAAARGCLLAKPNPTQSDLARARECKIVYDVDPSLGPRG